MPVTITLPDELVARLLKKHTDVNNFAVAAITQVLDDEESQIDDWQPNEEDLAAIGRGIADSDAGRFRDGNLFLKELRERASR